MATWAIFDQAIWDGPGRGARIPANPHLERAGGTILKADTLRGTGGQGGPAALRSRRPSPSTAGPLLPETMAKLDPPRTNPAGTLRPIDQPSVLCRAHVCRHHLHHGRDRDRRARPGTEGLRRAHRRAVCRRRDDGGLEGCGAPTYIGGLMKGLVFGLRAAEHVAQSARNGTDEVAGGATSPAQQMIWDRALAAAPSSARRWPAPRSSNRGCGREQRSSTVLRRSPAGPGSAGCAC
jgi:hypothetical protein